MRKVAITILLIKALVLANILALVVRKNSIPLIEKWSLRLSRVFKTNLKHTEQEIVWASYVVTTKLFWTNTCLIRSLCCYTLLTSANFQSELIIGVKSPQRPTFEAHAWVENKNHQVICEDTVEIDQCHKIYSL